MKGILQEDDENPEQIGQNNSSRIHSETLDVTPNSKSGSSPATVTVPVISKSLRRDVLKLFHDSPQAGHFGVKKTKKSLRIHVYWANMTLEVQDYIRTCETCQKKYSNKLPPDLLGTVEPHPASFQTLHMDFIGSLQISAGGRNNASLINKLSKWSEIFPMRSATAKKVTEYWEDQVLCLFGALKLLSPITVNISYPKFSRNDAKMGRYSQIRQPLLSAS